jgi:hypothetical protein
MNSVHLFVRDATGTQYLDTFTANTAEEIAAFRKHANWWKGYMRSPAGQRAHRHTTKGAPVFPVEIVIAPYQDASAG